VWVRTPLSLPALYIVAVIGTAASSAIPAEPEQAVRGPVVPAPRLGNSKTEPTANAGGQERTRQNGAGRVASATSPLDLSKLSMSDFGDVAQDY